MFHLIEGIKEHLILNDEEVLEWGKCFAKNKDILLLYEEDQILGCMFINYEIMLKIKVLNYLFQLLALNQSLQFLMNEYNRF